MKEVDPSARESKAGLFKVAHSPNSFTQPGYIYPGNDLEGNALHTIADVLSSSGFYHQVEGEADGIYILSMIGEAWEATETIEPLDRLEPLAV